MAKILVLFSSSLFKEEDERHREVISFWKKIENIDASTAPLERKCASSFIFCFDKNETVKEDLLVDIQGVVNEVMRTVGFSKLFPLAKEKNGKVTVSIKKVKTKGKKKKKKKKKKK